MSPCVFDNSTNPVCNELLYDALRLSLYAPAPALLAPFATPCHGCHVCPTLLPVSTAQHWIQLLGLYHTTLCAVSVTEGFVPENALRIGQRNRHRGQRLGGQGGLPISHASASPVAAHCTCSALSKMISSLQAGGLQPALAHCRKPARATGPPCSRATAASQSLSACTPPERILQAAHQRRRRQRRHVPPLASASTLSPAGPLLQDGWPLWAVLAACAAAAQVCRKGCLH